MHWWHSLYQLILHYARLSSLTNTAVFSCDQHGEPQFLLLLVVEYGLRLESYDSGTSVYLQLEWHRLLEGKPVTAVHSVAHHRQVEQYSGSILLDVTYDFLDEHRAALEAPRCLVLRVDLAEVREKKLSSLLRAGKSVGGLTDDHVQRVLPALLSQLAVDEHADATASPRARVRRQHDVAGAGDAKQVSDVVVGRARGRRARHDERLAPRRDARHQGARPGRVRQQHGRQLGVVRTDAAGQNHRHSQPQPQPGAAVQRRHFRNF